MDKNKKALEIDLRTATKSDLLSLSNNLRVISKIHGINFSSNIIFILSIVLAIFLGIIINTIFSLMELSKRTSLFLLAISSLILLVTIFILILKAKKSAQASRLLDKHADKILEDYFSLKK